MNGTTQTTTPPTECSQCLAPMRHIPAGISQTTGKGYPEFWACSNRCGFTWKKLPIPQQPAGAGGLGKAVGNMLTKETFIQGLGLLRGDIQKINTQLIPLLEKLMETLARFENEDKVVFYPGGQGSGRKTIELPAEEDPDSVQMDLKDL